MSGNTPTGNRREAKYWQQLTIAAASNVAMGSSDSFKRDIVRFADSMLLEYQQRFCGVETIPAAVVLKLIGGKWPEANGFAWDRVEFFEVNEDGTISPADGYDLLPGPDLKLRVTELLGL